ncbi:cyclic nucleotide-binding and patatin-like phospholipase domain-containing protein [Ktedonosporobacter rubrisoli]|nr:cyclic nucleotide-binding and patatin-like phospholipase domain-containing protein [Ktedonosporobacter rubrisoli]
MGADKLIEKSELFRHLQPQESEAILARLRSSHYEPGACILERGRWHGQLYIIARGQVRVVLPSEDEQQGSHASSLARVVARLGPGECFGEMSLISGEPPGASIYAEQETELWSLAQADFLALIGSCPTLSRNINTILSQRLTRTNQHLFPQRTQFILLSLSEPPAAPLEQALAFHLADALTACTHKRVLLLELCSQEEASYAHFARHAGQMRPDLLSCAQERSLLQAHYAPLAAEDQYFPAIAPLTASYEQLLILDTAVLSLLDELVGCYDYILLVADDKTPTHVISALCEEEPPIRLARAIALVASCTIHSYIAPALACEQALFVTRVPEAPTIGLQDRYAQQLGQPVVRLLPADNALLERCWQARLSLREQVPEVPLSRAVDFVARYIARQTIGIAFGGGGARGFAHLGILAGLLEMGIPLDYIAACSSGILAPGMHLIGKSQAESEAIFMEIQRHIVRWNFPRTSLFSNSGIKKMLRSICGEVRFEDLTTPFAIIAADLATRAGVAIERGPLWRACLASVALPGIFPPVLIGEHILIDAGMHDPVPIRQVRQMGADILLAAELGGQEPPALLNAASWSTEAEQPNASSPHIIDLLLRSYDLAMATIGTHSIREADVVLRPRLHRVSLRQFAAGHKFIAAGREAVAQALPELREHLPWLS